jgi:GTP-binding protein
LLWEELNAESNKLQAISEGGSIVHRDREVERFNADFSDWQYADIEESDDDDAEYLDEYEIEDLED